VTATTVMRALLCARVHQLPLFCYLPHRHHLSCSRLRHTPSPVASDDRSDPIDVNAESDTATGPEQAQEEDPVQEDAVSNLCSAPGTGGSRQNRGVGWIREEREVVGAVYV